jgi:purine-cytosine permease-like protein
MHQPDCFIRYAWLPQALALAVWAGTAGPNFDLTTPSTGTPEQVNANRLSFFSLAMSCSIAWAPAGADFYVYYPQSTARWKTFLMSFMGLGTAIIVTLVLGAGVGTAMAVVPAWSDAYDVSPGSLLEASYLPVNGFGKFCAVVVALGVISNNIPGTYSAALSFQMLGRYGLAVPRSIWTCVCVIIYTACALGGRNSLFDIFENFLPLMGYWIVVWLTIIIEEDLIFRRGKPYDWSAWNDREKLPLGIAGFIAFLIGWAGAIIGMVSSLCPFLLLVESSRLMRFARSTKYIMWESSLR